MLSPLIGNPIASYFEASLIDNKIRERKMFGFIAQQVADQVWTMFDLEARQGERDSSQKETIKYVCRLVRRRMGVHSRRVNRSSFSGSGRASFEMFAAFNFGTIMRPKSI